LSGIEDAFREAPPPPTSGKFDLWLPPDAVIAAMARDGEPVPTGWAPLDRQLRGGGIRPGRVVGVGGPAFSGKTTIVAAVGLHMAQFVPVYALFSDEGRAQAALRMGVMLGVPLEELESEPEKAAKKVGELLGERSIYLLNPGRQDSHAEAVVAHAKANTPAGSTALVILDSIQTIRTRGNDPEEEESVSPSVRRLMKSCRAWADETRFIFLLASWVTRDSYKYKKRAENVHKLASFFGGASVEHCLDVGVCLDLPDDDGIVPVEVPKNRLYKHGASKRFSVRYDEATGRMLEIDAPAADDQRAERRKKEHEGTVSKVMASIEKTVAKRGRMSTRQLCELTGGKRTNVLEALHGLEAQGVFEPLPGPKGAILWGPKT
jgi:predicted ATP-dependent serine protease